VRVDELMDGTGPEAEGRRGGQPRPWRNPIDPTGGKVLIAN